MESQDSFAARLNRLLGPFGGAMVHLVLIGAPIPFAFYHTSPSLAEALLISSPCALFDGFDGKCSPLEEFAIRDLGYRFLRNFLLSFVSCCIVATRGDETSHKALLRFHRTLIYSSLLTVLVMACQQYFASGVYDRYLFAITVLNHLLAIALSFWVFQPIRDRVSKTAAMSAAWSVPGIAILAGEAANVLVIAASIQAFTEENGLSKIFLVNNVSEFSPIARTSCLLATTHPINHVLILMRIREVSTVRQMKLICLYQFLFNVVLNIVWLPEQDQHMKVNTKFMLTLRSVLLGTYAFGYLFAGKAQKVSRIMSMEKSS